MKAYFRMNEEIYKDEKNVVLVFLNKMSKGRGGTFTEVWYIKLVNPAIPESEKTFKKLCNTFEETFILKHIKDWACQTVYSLNMDQFNGDFDQYATTFRLAQACSGINLNSILVDALQWGVTNQLTVMMTTTALLAEQEKTGWKWEQWLDKAGELYKNVVRLRKLRSGGNSYIPPVQMARTAHPARDPYAMDVDKTNLSPRDRVEHMQNNKGFICHKEGCHLSKHKGYPKWRGKPPQPGAWPSWRATETREVEGDPWINNFIKQHGISAEKTLDLLGNYYSYKEPATTWENTVKEESVNQISLDF